MLHDNGRKTSLYAVTFAVSSAVATVHPTFMIVASNPDEANYIAKDYAWSTYKPVESPRHPTDTNSVTLLSTRQVDGMVAIGLNTKYTIGVVPLTALSTE